METDGGRDDERRAEGRPDEDGRGDGGRVPEGPAPRGRFEFERGWMVVAVLLLVAAAVLLYLGRPSAAFVVAALGMSAWFLNVRNGLKRRHDLVRRGGRNWEPRGRDEE